MFKKELSDLRQYFMTFGINANGKYSLRFWMYCVVLLFLTFNSILIIIYDWDDMNKRMEGLKGFVMYLISVEYLSVFIFNYRKIMELLEIFEEGPSKFSLIVTPRRLDLEKRIKNDTNHFITMWCLIQNSILVFMPLPSVIMLIVQLWKTDFMSISVDKLSLPLDFYFPVGYTTLSLYLLVLTMQCFYFYEATRSVIVIVGPPCIATQRIKGEIKLLGLSLDELDYESTNNLQGWEDQSYDVLKKEHEFHYAKITLRNFIQHQQFIYGRTEKIIRSIQMAAFYLDTGLHALLSVSIYSLAKNRDVIVKIQELLFGCVVISFIYYYHMSGEKVTIEHDNVRQALYQTDWVDKPLWYKKWLLCIMTSLNKTAEIKQSGIFSLNLHNFVVTVRAAYSFFNLLTKFSE